MIAAGVGFVAPASKTYVPATVLADLDLNTAAEVDYLAERDTGKPADTRGRWRVVEDTMTVCGPRKKDPVLTLRRVSCTPAPATVVGWRRCRFPGGGGVLRGSTGPGRWS
jgi:hypothetical protein